MVPLIERIGRTYDELPYTSHPFWQSAPEHLRAVAHLFGLEAPAVDRARVLELGCAAGGNLVPFAARHPQAQVVGIDLSAVQIEAGQRAVGTMGLKNVSLIQGSIAELDPGLGKFDYIVCHGVYSWVPENVREAILRALGDLLTPNGVAYVSYNAYPGWKAKEIVRDAMLLRGGHHGTAGEQIAYGRGMIEFLHEMAPADSLLSKAIADDIEIVRNAQDYYLAHEYFELCNAPCYFRDFVGAARSHGLEYLGDATVGSMFASNYGRAAQPLLSECGGDQVVLEQLLDFLNNRTFRQTLLVRGERSEAIRYQLDGGRIANMHVAGHYVPNGQAQDEWQYAFGRATVTAGMETTRGVIAALNAAWPATVPVRVLLDAAGADAAEAVLTFVTNLIVGNAVQIRCEPVAAPALGECPEARAEVRALSVPGEMPVALFNEWHRTVEPGALERFLLARLDGRTDATQLIDAVATAIHDGVLSLTRDGKALQDPADIAASAAELTGRSLNWLARNALLAPATASASDAAEQSAQASKSNPKAAAKAPPQAKPAKQAKAASEGRAPGKPKRS